MHLCTFSLACFNNPLKTFRNDKTSLIMPLCVTTEHFSGQCKYSINVENLIGGKKNNVKSLPLEFFAILCYF